MSTAFGSQTVGSRMASVGAMCLIGGALLQFTLGIVFAGLQSQERPLPSIVALNIASHLLLIAGVVGLARSGAAGDGLSGAIGFGLTLFGLAVGVVAEGNWLLGLTSVDLLYGIATVAMGVGLILAGIAALGAGRWSGWRRFTILACGLYIPLVLFPSFALPGAAMNYAIGAWGVCWLLAGLALQAESTNRGHLAP